ncbi:imm11 family protein [Roseibium sp.]|uniref:imm11 family protein n=1 Tax=Roseibium sp. TaxID=1936156 RepID=UPI003BA84C56
MNVYELDADFDTRSYVRGVWSIDQSHDSIIKEGAWKARRQSRLHEDGRLFAEDISKYQTHWLVVNVCPLPELHIIGEFNTFRTGFPVVNQKLRDALERVNPGGFEFVEITQVWAEKQACLVPGGPFYVTNLLTERDTWDEKSTEIYKIKHVDGHDVERIDGTKKTVRSSALHGATIWRESRTGHVLCTEPVKQQLEEAGCRGWKFRPVHISEN